MITEELIENIDEDSSEESQAGMQYLSFVLANEKYAVDILHVREIMGWNKVTRVPSAPNFVKGVLNLRGAIIPVIDLRIRFELPKVEYTATSVVIVFSVKSHDHERIIGVVVDAVSDVEDVLEEEIKPVPNLSQNIDTTFLTGLVKRQGQPLMLLNMDQLLTDALIGVEDNFSNEMETKRDA